jgi:hypothetical protein
LPALAFISNLAGPLLALELRLKPPPPSVVYRRSTVRVAAQREDLAASAGASPIFIEAKNGASCHRAERPTRMHRALLLEQFGVATSAEAIRIAVGAGLQPGAPSGKLTKCKVSDKMRA